MRASRMATALPIPREAPVTKAYFMLVQYSTFGMQRYELANEKPN